MKWKQTMVGKFFETEPITTNGRVSAAKSLNKINHKLRTQHDDTYYSEI